MSTLTDETRSYHHGDLRAALVSAGLHALETTDVGEISLRGLAREIGVSATAVYRHFPDKRALLEAMASEGLAQLGQAQLRAAQAGGDQAFSETGRAYVRFALANPGLFRLVFTHCSMSTADMEQDSIAAKMLHYSASQMANGDEFVAQRIAVQAWALVHGLAMLILDGQLPHDDMLIDRVIDGEAIWHANAI